MTAALSRMTHSLSSEPFLTLSSTHQPNCLDPTLIAASRPPLCSLTVEQGGRILGGRRHSLHPIGSENVQSSEQMCWENSSHSPARCWWPGSVLGSWERGKRSQRSRLPTQQLTPPLISISSYSHKPNCLTFQHGSHVNRAFLVASSKSASFCLEGAAGYSEDVALTKPQPIACIWYSRGKTQGKCASLFGTSFKKWFNGSFQEDRSLIAMSLRLNTLSRW